MPVDQHQKISVLLEINIVCNGIGLFTFSSIISFLSKHFYGFGSVFRTVIFPLFCLASCFGAFFFINAQAQNQ